ncbi:MAG TPA: M1 family metallopeptidase [Vicinamibacterales bacterium]|nr:M1 family metallopeptidase [Vicinamibacterales bacterium]
MSGSGWSTPWRRSALVVVVLLSAARVEAQRLPRTVVPDHYDISVAPDLANATFAGTTRIRVRLDKPSTEVVLNAAEIAFDSVTIAAGGRTQTAKVALDAAREQATFTVAEPIPAGAAEIDIAYRGILNGQLRGLYLSQANNRRYAVTQLEATDARRMFPSFDEPAFKATFALTATIDAGDTAISNGVVVSDTPGPGAGKHTLKFDVTPKMSTYLVALAVGDFVCSEGTPGTPPVRVCSTPDKKALTGFAVEAARKVIEYYDTYYTTKYPFKKLDIVAVPDFSAGAMENTGAIFYREEYLLAAPESASVGTRKLIASVLGHEIGHQWFGDLVTMAWWDDIWLNEGFATWAANKPVSAWKPEWNLELLDILSNQAALRLDSLQSTRPVRSSANSPAEISELFDGIAYEKSGAVLRMVESWLGPEVFRKGVNAYIERFKYGNATAEDFWGTLATSSGQPVDRVMASFVNQPGVPLVHVDVACGAGGATATLTQDRFVEGAAPGQPSPPWSIPVCLKTSSGKITCEVMSAKTAALKLDACPAWVLPNAGARGYYRTSYSPEMLRKIAAGIAAVSSAERIGLLSDEWALVRAGRHDVGSYMDLASVFGSERTPEVLANLTGTLRGIGEDLTTPASRPAYRQWVSKLLKPALKDVGWEAKPGELESRQELRAIIVRTLGAARDPEVLAKSRELVLGELKKPGTVDPTLLGVVVHLAAIDGSPALYDMYLARAKAADDPEEKYRYLHALASFTDEALARRTLAYVLGPEIRSQDAKLFLADMLTNPSINLVAWQMLKERWAEVQKKTGEFVGNTIVVSALGAFCDARMGGEVSQFFETHKVPDAERTLQQSLERIAACARRAETQAPKLSAWLTSRR